MRNWLKWIRISLGVCTMLALLGLAQSQPTSYNEVPVVEWNADDTQDLIDYSTVLSWTSGFASKSSRWPQIDSIEERLGRHPSVHQVQASVGINGTIRIQIDQRDPLLRLMDSLGHQLYLDKSKHLMPALVGVPARLPVVTGLPNLSRLKSDTLLLQDLMELANSLYADPFWWIFSDQISVNSTQGFVLTPKIGKHQIILGSTLHLPGKLKKLKLFYTKGLHPADWNLYSIIDGRYQGQIVCQPAAYLPLPTLQPADSLPSTDSILSIQNPI